MDKTGSDKKKHRFPIWAIVIICVAAAVAAVLGIGYAYVHSQLGRINRVETETALAPEEEYFETGETFEDEQVETVRSEDVQWDVDTGTFSQEGVTNILLIGQDSHEGEQRSRSDSMIVVSINENTGKIALTSLMRDMYVQIPGYSDNRINAAYAFGGMELLDATIAKNFAIKIDGNIEVNFEGFEAVIDAVGGVDIELTPIEAAYLNNRHSSWKLKIGMNHLDGKQALTYARLRKVGKGDFERTQRQRQVLMAVFDQVKDIRIDELISFVHNLFPLLTTDMSNSQILSLGTKVLGMDLDTLETYRIPEDGSYEEMRVYASDGTAMDVLIPDLSDNRYYFYNNIYAAGD
ncbi:MAG TPA: LCP family protein [Candidatus Scybalocola faecavium]|nr:LCP family protein [Candidatus Scybalocola faecavium]